MKENVPQKKLFRCILAVTLAAGLALPSVGAFAYGSPEETSSDSLTVNDRPLDAGETGTGEALPPESDEHADTSAGGDGVAPDSSAPGDGSENATGGGALLRKR